MTTHLQDLELAMPRLRDRVAEYTRATGPDFTTTVSGWSRLIGDRVGLLALLERRREEFAVVPVGDDIRTPKNPGEATLRDRAYQIRLVIAQWKSGKTAEDLFYQRLEAIETRWGRLDTLAVDVTGAGDEVEFDVAIESVESVLTVENENFEVIGYGAERLLTFTVQGCAT